MTGTETFALLVTLVAAVGLAAVLSTRLTELVRLPPAAMFLVAAAVAIRLVPALPAPSPETVERVVSLALVAILFNAGNGMGAARVRAALGPIALSGVLGTLLVVVSGALVVHVLTGLTWYLSSLVAAAVAPTDPAVVFAVLGRWRIGGRASTILEGESGVNDPVGIALMVGLIGAGGLGWHALGAVGARFAAQLLVGLGVGVLGGRTLLWFVRRVAVTSASLAPLRTGASVLILYGLATVAHGSGFLAVFVAGIVLGGEPAPYREEVEQFHATVASLAEIVAFVVLGLTVDLPEIVRPGVWIPGLALGVLMAVLIRPTVIGLCLLGARLDRNDRAFVLATGLKGAVPILLATLLVVGHVAHARRLYDLVVVVVVFSVVVQASLVPTVARWLRMPLFPVVARPWGIGVRLGHEPTGVCQLTVAQGSPAVHRTLGEVTALAGGAWINLVVRDGRALPLRAETVLASGDVLLVLAAPAERARITALITGPPAPGTAASREVADDPDPSGPA